MDTFGDVIIIKKCPREFTKNMSMKIHQKYPQKSTQKCLPKVTEREDLLWTFCPQEFTKSVHENSPILSTKIFMTLNGSGNKIVKK